MSYFTNWGKPKNGVIKNFTILSSEIRMKSDWTHRELLSYQNLKKKASKNLLFQKERAHFYRIFIYVLLVSTFLVEQNVEEDHKQDHRAISKKQSLNRL